MKRRGRRAGRILPCCLAALIAAASPATVLAGPEFAYTPEKWETLKDDVMEYHELPDLVHEYNPEVRNARVDYNSYYDKDRDDISDSYWKAAADAADSVQYPESEDSGYAAKYADAQAAEVTIRRLKQQAIDNLEDGEIKKYNYEKKEAQVTNSVQKDMIAYNQYLLQLQQAQENKKYLDEVYHSTQVRLNAGLATQSDLLGARQGVLDAEASIKELEHSVQDTRQKLCVATGWSYDAQPDIRSIPEADIGRIASLNPEADKAAALQNNYTLLINKRKLYNSQDDTTSQGLNITIGDNESRIASDIDLCYHAIQQSLVSYQQAQAELEVETRNMNAANLQYQAGTISRLKYLEAENNFVQKQVNLQLKNMDLQQALETYDWNVKGLGSSV